MPWPPSAHAGQHIAIVAFKRTGDFIAPRAVRGLQGPLELFRAGKAQVQTIVPVADQRIAIRRHPAPFDIGGGGTQKAGQVGDQPDLQRAILKNAKVKGDVEPLGGQVDQAVGQPQPHINLRVKRVEGGHMGRDEAPPDAQGGRHKHHTARVLRHLHHRSLCLFNRLQHLAGPVIEQAAILGRLQAAGGAVEQAHAEVPLQLRYPGRGDGRRGALIPGSRTHTAQFIDADEHLQGGDIGHFGFRAIFESDPRFTGLTDKCRPV